MNCKLLIGIVLLITPSLFAFSQMSDSTAAGNLIITTSLFDYIPTQINTGNYNFGIERYRKNQNSIGFNTGLIRSYGPSRGLFNISAENTWGLKFQLTVKHFFNRHKVCEPVMMIILPHLFQLNSQIQPNTGWYTATHLFYQWTSTDRNESAYNPQLLHYEKNVYTVYRNNLGINLLFGYQCIKKYGLVVDFSIGFGGQYISSRSKNRLGDDTDWPNQEKEFHGKLFDHGAGFYPSIYIQQGFGWAF